MRILIEDKEIWVGTNKGFEDELLLAGKGNKGGWHISKMIDFCKKNGYEEKERVDKRGK